jgi:hypothetical protein
MAYAAWRKAAAFYALRRWNGVEEEIVHKARRLPRFLLLSILSTAGCTFITGGGKIKGIASSSDSDKTSFSTSVRSDRYVYPGAQDATASASNSEGTDADVPINEL